MHAFLTIRIEHINILVIFVTGENYFDQQSQFYLLAANSWRNIFEQIFRQLILWLKDLFTLYHIESVLC